MEALQKLLMFDLLAPPVTLNFRGHSSIKTIFGLFMTLFYLMAIAVYSFTVGMSYFDTTDLKVTQQTSETGVFPRIDLGANKLLPVIYILDSNLHNTKAKEFSKYLTITFKKQRYSVTADLSDNASINYTVIPMAVVPCGDLMKNSSAYEYYKIYENSETFKNFADDYGLCIQVNDTEAYVKGGVLEPNLDILTLDFYPCTLTSGCASFEEMTQVGLIISLPSYSLNYSNYATPVTPLIITDHIVYVNPASSGRFTMKVNINEIHDDRGVLFGKRRFKANFSQISSKTSSQRYRSQTQINCSIDQIKKNTCISYFSFDFYSSGQKVTILRSYKTMPQCFAEIGGLNSILFVGFFFINYLYASHIKKKTLLESTFEFLDPKQLSSYKTEPGSPLSGKSKDDKRDDLQKLEKINLQNARKMASTLIERNLDLVTLVKEINNLKMVTRMLLENYQVNLVSAATLNLELLIQESRKSHASVEKEDSLPGLTESPSHQQEGELTLEEAIEKLRMDSSSNPGLQTFRAALERSPLWILDRMLRSNQDKDRLTPKLCPVKKNLNKIRIGGQSSPIKSKGLHMKLREKVQELLSDRNNTSVVSNNKALQSWKPKVDPSLLGNSSVSSKP